MVWNTVTVWLLTETGVQFCTVYTSIVKAGLMSKYQIKIIIPLISGTLITLKVQEQIGHMKPFIVATNL